MSKKRSTAVAVGTASALLATVALGACSSNAGGQSGESGSASGTQQIEFYQFRKEATDVINELIAMFEEENPDIKVTQTITPDPDTVLLSRLAKNDVPDVVAVNGNMINEIATSGFMIDLEGTDALAAVDNQVTMDYVRSVSGTDETVLIPWMINSAGVLYDCDQFEEMGLEVPTTWTEFQAILEKIKAEGKTGFYQAWKDNWTASVLFNEVGGDFVPAQWWSDLQSGKGSFEENPAWTEVGQRMVDTKAYSQDDPFGKGYDDANTAFANGEAVMYIMGTWAINQIKDVNPDRNVCMFVPPWTDNADETVVVTGVDPALGISKSSKNPEAAQKFVDFLMSYEASNIYANDQDYFSVRNDVASTNPVVAEIKSEWIDTGRSNTYPDNRFRATQNIYAIMQQLLQDENYAAMVSGLDNAWATDGIK